MYRIFYERFAYTQRGTLDYLIWRTLYKSGTKSLDAVKAEMREWAEDEDFPDTELDFRARANPEVTEVFVNEAGRGWEKLATIFTGTTRKVFYSPFDYQCNTFLMCEGMFRQEGGLAVERSRPDVLAKYGKDVTVIVVGHGDRVAGLMTCDCGNCGEEQWDGKKGFDPRQLWERLKRDGLVENVKTIRLHMCLGADDPKQGGLSFAAQFSAVVEEDETFDSSGTRVLSYHGYLTMTKDGSFSYTDRADDATRLPAKQRREIFKQRQ